MKDISKEPQDVQDFYNDIVELIDIMIDGIVTDKKSINFNQVINIISSDLEINAVKLRKFLKTFSGNKYIDKYFVSGEKISKQRFYKIKTTAMKKLSKKSYLRNYFLTMGEGFDYMSDFGSEVQ